MYINKESNFGTAVYIAHTMGNNVPEEVIVKIARELNMKPKVLLRNYRIVTGMDKIFEAFKR